MPKLLLVLTLLDFQVRFPEMIGPIPFVKVSDDKFVFVGRCFHKRIILSIIRIMKMWFSEVSENSNQF